MANSAFHRPHNSRSGAIKNSGVFMVATRPICNQAHVLGRILLDTQMANNISPPPIALVSHGANSAPVNRATIHLCRGTIPSTLHHRPLASHTRPTSQSVTCFNALGLIQVQLGEYIKILVF